jgi:acetyl-CoA/propionyl-CoA carboxylase biotin carboxyl carrier protein
VLQEAVGRAALDEAAVLGPVTNLRFLRWLVRQPWIRDGEARVDTLERAWSDAPESRFLLPASAWAAAGRAWAWAARASPGGQWTGGWRLNAPSTVRLSAEGEERDVRLETGPSSGPSAVTSRASAGAAAVISGTSGASGASAVSSHASAVTSDGSILVDVDGRTVAFRLSPPPDVDRPASPRAAHGGAGRAQVVAPMPGSVLSIHVAPGAEISAGDPIATLEAMKMEHVVTAPLAGTVAEVGVAQGEQVLRGSLLAIIEP